MHNTGKINQSTSRQITQQRLWSKNMVPENITRCDVRNVGRPVRQHVETEGLPENIKETTLKSRL
jgi:hypothetical protein